MGLQEPVVRINVDAPRIGVRKDPALLAQVFARLAALVQAVLDGKLTYRGLLDGIEDPTCVGCSGPTVLHHPGMVPHHPGTLRKSSCSRRISQASAGSR